MPEVPEPEQVNEETGFFAIPYPNHYSNASSIASTFMEFSITFYEQVDQDHATVKARIAMPPAHAKLLATLLNSHLQFWEKKWGDIRIPDDLLRRAGIAPSGAAPTPEEVEPES